MQPSSKSYYRLSDENVSRALRGEASGSDSIHVGPAAETVGERQKVRSTHYRVA